MEKRRRIGLWLALMITASISVSAGAQKGPKMEIRVGIKEGDIQGSDHRALQSAVDYVASLGGGTVHILEGRYLLSNALRLRDNVNLRGVPGKTILAACDGLQSRLSADGDCNERQITLADPAGFRVGDGVTIQDDDAGGFAVTTATLTSQVDSHTFRISMPLYLDYMVAKNASVKRAFPVVGGWQAKNVVIEGLTIEGNRERAHYLNGCRGGGIYLFECEQVTMRRCTVRNFNGDGISFQVSQHVTLEDCLAENNAGLGLHPGSGSQHPILRRNRSQGNDSDGLYVCWRVKHGLFEENEIRGNQRVGISIGHKDSDNVFRRNTVVGNGDAGLLFRDESEPMGAHRNVFEENKFLDNGLINKKEGSRACIVIRGTHHDLVFRRNTIGNTSPTATPVIGLLVSPFAKGLTTEGNHFVNVKAEIEKQK